MAMFSAMLDQLGQTPLEMEEVCKEAQDQDALVSPVTRPPYFGNFTSLTGDESLRLYEQTIETDTRRDMLLVVTVNSPTSRLILSDFW